MIPESVTFSDLGTLDPDKLLNSRILRGAPPLSWTRVEIHREDFVSHPEVDRWCLKHLQGKWARQSAFYRRGSWIFVMFFEQMIDAVFFKMSGDEPFE